MTHNDSYCTKYKAEVLPDEDGNCSLCGATLQSEEPKKCKHEQDIDFGKHRQVTDNLRAIQIMCVWCGGVGTQIEERDESEPEHWYSIAEMWHELQDYYADDFIQERSYKAIGVN